MSSASGESIWLSTNSARFLTSVVCWPASTFLMIGNERSGGCDIRPSIAASASDSCSVGVCFAERLDSLTVCANVALLAKRSSAMTIV